MNLLGKRGQNTSETRKNIARKVVAELSSTG
jgi:hypothetical protein